MSPDLWTGPGPGDLMSALRTKPVIWMLVAAVCLLQAAPLQALCACPDSGDMDCCAEMHACSP